MSGLALYSCLAFLVIVVAFTLLHLFKPLPDGLSFRGEPRAASNVAFLNDTSWIDSNGNRQTDQEIFDSVFSLIEGAEKLILVDMFLYNDFQGPKPEATRALSSELTNALIQKKTEVPDIEIIVISDLLNTLYGGLPSQQFEKLKQAGIPVVLTKLPRLRDSNFAYSFIWRVFIRPFGNSPATTVPNPIGPGRVSIRSWLALANFKANHRKTILADSGDNHVGIVMSANPHDASSAHRNAAIRFDGLAVADLLATENTVLAMSGGPQLSADIRGADNPDGPKVQIVTEYKIERAVRDHINRAGEGDRIDLMMFYLADRNVIKALKTAHKRGADIRVLLDFNKDAFGREKNGVPNRPVAEELMKQGVPVRWCKTDGEQCHYKLLSIEYASGERVVINGSANFSRRNLNALNLETDVVVTGMSDTVFFQNVRDAFEQNWANTKGRTYSMPYETLGDPPEWHHLLYRFMEWSGLSTF